MAFDAARTNANKDSTGNSNGARAGVAWFIAPPCPGRQWHSMRWCTTIHSVLDTDMNSPSPPNASVGAFS